MLQTGFEIHVIFYDFPSFQIHLLLHLLIGSFVCHFQYVTEKMGGAEGTKLDLDFMEMERVSSWNRKFAGG